MIGPCAKRVVTATIITTTGQRFVGTNHCLNAQPYCERATQEYRAGEGYYLCRDVCGQHAHAEVNALAQAIGTDIIGATMYVDHTWVCKDCKEIVAKNGLTNPIVIGAPPA